MRAHYKFLDNIDLSSNIIANVSKIVGNDYLYTTGGENSNPNIDFNDLIITTCDYSNDINQDDDTASRNTSYRGDVLIRAGVAKDTSGTAEDTSKSGYVHIFAGVENEINANKIVPEGATTDWTDEDGIRVCPTGDLRFSDARIRSYFTDEFEIHGAANNLNTFHTLYKVEGKFTKYSLKESEANDAGYADSESGGSDGDVTGDTIRHIADYFRIDTIHGSKGTADSVEEVEEVGFIDLDTYDFDLYSKNNINIHTKSRGSTAGATVYPASFKSGQSNPVFATGNKTTITTSYLAENAANIIIDNSDSFITYTGNKYEVYVGSYKAGTTTTRPTGSDRALYLKLNNSGNGTANNSSNKDFTINLVNNTADNKSWGNDKGESDTPAGTFSADDFLDARADIIRLTATSKTVTEADSSNVVSSTTEADGLIQLNAGYLDAKVNTLLGIDTANLNIIARTSHIRVDGDDASNFGLLHLLHSTNPSDENTLKGIIIYDETEDSDRYNGITLGTNEKINKIPTVFVEDNKVTSAFMYLTKDTINEWSTNTNLDIDDYLKFKVGSGTTYTAPDTTTIFSLVEDLTSTNGETTLDIRKGLTFLRTDDFRLNINHNTEIKIDGAATPSDGTAPTPSASDYLFDIYLNESNGDNSTSAYITAQTNASAANGITLNQRKFSIARETISGNRWNSETGAFERVDNETAVVGRLDNLKVNKVFNIGMNKDKFAIYWDEDTSSLVFTQGEILWQ